MGRPINRMLHTTLLRDAGSPSYLPLHQSNSAKSAALSYLPRHVWGIGSFLDYCDRSALACLAMVKYAWKSLRTD